MSSSGSILMIDDDEQLIMFIKTMLNDMNYEVQVANDGEKGIALLAEDESIDIILLDQKLPGISGIETFEKIKKLNTDVQVIMITGHASVSDAVSAFKMGVFDYLTKPVGSEHLELTVGRAMKLVILDKENKRLKQALGKMKSSEGIVASSKNMLEIIEKVRNIAGLDSTALISGESGTGKELFARSIHNQSPRHKGPFIAVNCAALNEELLGSALFGFEKGAFTGAIRTTKGCFEEAKDGTLFLDEVGDMSPKLQSSLLRVLQEREFCRIGSYKPIKVDFRVITATNKILEDEVRAGAFREDLYYRLNVIPILLPALRDRHEDIPLLALRFLEDINKKFKKNVGPFSLEAMTTMINYSWPGNCRELENIVELIVAVKSEGEISVNDLPKHISGATDNVAETIHSTKKLMPFADEKKWFEKQYLKRAMAECEGNISRMSSITNIPRPNLYQKLKKHGLR